ncbi:MAG: DUF3726 domain-containing protein [Aestuariivirgaceae bacterium]
MRTSFDEIRKIAFRALDSAGAPPGLDEDGGWACAWLEATGHPGLRMLADMLDDGEDLSAGVTCGPTGEIDAKGRSAVCLGSVIAEFAAGQGGNVNVRNLRHSTYLIPHAARLAERGTVLAIVSPTETLSDVTIRGGTDDYARERSFVTSAIQDGLDANKAAFDRVYDYSRNILVPQTEASLLTGAGAGLTDND